MKKPRKAEKLEDPEQSQRFFQGAREIEAAGGLSAEEAEKEMEKLMRPVKTRPPASR